MGWGKVWHGLRICCFGLGYRANRWKLGTGLILNGD